MDSCLKSFLKTNKLKVLNEYTAADYGPLSFHQPEKNHASTFRNSSYVMVTPVTSITLYRLYDGYSNGQCYSLSKKTENFAMKRDYSLKKRYIEDTQLVIPHGAIFFVGSVALQVGTRQYLSGLYKAFVPNVTLQYFKEAQKAKDSNKMFLMKAYSAQKYFLENYQNKVNQVTEEYLDKLLSVQHAHAFVYTGNLRYYSLFLVPRIYMSPLFFFFFKNFSRHRVPVLFLQALESANNGLLRSQNELPTGTHNIHLEKLHLPNGQNVQLFLSATIKYDGATSRTHIRSKINVNEKIHHYTIIYKWSQ